MIFSFSILLPSQHQFLKHCTGEKSHNKAELFQLRAKPSYSTVSTNYTELAVFDRIQKGVTDSIWVGYFSLQIVLNTYILLNRVWNVEFDMGRYYLKHIMNNSTQPVSQDNRSNTYSSKKYAHKIYELALGVVSINLQPISHCL